MTEEYPCYKEECDNAVADYDYEVGQLLKYSQLEPTEEAAPLEVSSRAASGRLMMVAGLVLVIIIGGAYFASTLRSSGKEAEAPTSVSDSSSSWVDSLEPPRTPSAVTPRPAPTITLTPIPQPAPSLDPGIAPTRCEATSDPRPSYQAVRSVVVGPYGPVPPPFGFVPVEGPAGFPPVFVEAERLGWWWNWRSGPDGCYEYYLDQDRLN